MAGGGTGTGCCTGSIDFRLAPDTRRGDGACATGERVGVGTRGEATCAATGGTTAAFSGAGVCCSRGDCLRFTGENRNTGLSSTAKKLGCLSGDCWGCPIESNLCVRGVPSICSGISAGGTTTTDGET